MDDISTTILAHSIELNTTDHGKITSVSVYSAHAEVTRSFKLGLKAGVNQADDRQGGREGKCYLSDVTVALPIAKKPDTDPKVAALKEELERTVNTLERTRSLLSSTEKYLESATAQYVDVSKLKEVTQNYEETAKGRRNVCFLASIAVSNAKWTCLYDVRVATNAEASSCDHWIQGIPHKLETASPTFGMAIPIPFRAGPSHPGQYRRSLPFPDENGSSSSITASFTVPGKMTIPSDNASHKVTIAQIPAEADMEWVCVPKRDSRVYLKAKVKNNSEYTLLQGPANIYVDGSLVARSNLPFPGPLYSRHLLSVVEEDHNANRLHDQTKQGAVVHSAGGNPQHQILRAGQTQVIDQIPISEEAGIVVKVISPVLPTTPSSSGHAKTTSDAASIASTSSKGYLVGKEDPQAKEKGNRPSGAALPNSVSIAQGIIAQWEGLEMSPLEMPLARI
ncbi:mucoidy inhibitor A [Coprinopsis sp. MPI-PUGE-AT-0042]|nr:mucoidy inhibitor A [Coprinopsis sp. MPI-PUGE-AT-0042]